MVNLLPLFENHMTFSERVGSYSFRKVRNLYIIDRDTALLDQALGFAL